MRIHGRPASAVPWYSLLKSIALLAIVLFTEVELIVAPDHYLCIITSLTGHLHVCCIVTNYSTTIRCTMSPSGDISIAFRLICDELGLRSLPVWPLPAYRRASVTSDCNEEPMERHNPTLASTRVHVLDLCPRKASCFRSMFSSSTSTPFMRLGYFTKFHPSCSVSRFVLS
ncbi:hypothetical protein BHM03_00008130 [Ensete ventricosum]|nr:hypothetical protein BHM03_00008130 [Ensete ventricosum]